MVIDFSFAGGFVVGIQHNDTAVVEIDEGEFEFCSAIMVHLGLFTMTLLFV
jgi:phage I-like protein